jgi:hypothetical protein
MWRSTVALSASNSAPHSPDSPDLAPSDFFLFGHIKRMMQVTEFQTAEELLEVV